MVRNAILKKYKAELAELRTLMSKADKNRSSDEDVRALTHFLRQHQGLWLYGANLAEWAIMALINGTGDSPAFKEMLKVGHEQLSQELLGNETNILEQLLVQQVVLAWLRLALVEYAYSTATHEETTFVKWEYLEKRLNASQRRFLRACETLARIRKLKVPIVQLNVAQQQINQINQPG